MTKKIVSINIGVILEVNESGKVRKITQSALFPSPAFKTPEEAIKRVQQFIKDNSGKSAKIRKATK